MVYGKASVDLYFLLQLGREFETLNLFEFNFIWIILAG